jgi:VanZ family protein
MTPKQLLRNCAFYLVFGLSIVILFLPAGEGLQPFAHFDKLVHVLLFGALCLTAMWRFDALIYVVAGVLAYAVVSEIVQGNWIPGREFDVLDMVVDAAGIVVGAWIGQKRRTA